MTREENPFYEAIGQISSSLRKKVFGTTSKAKPKTITRAQRAALASDGGFSKLLKAKKDAADTQLKAAELQRKSMKDKADIEIDKAELIMDSKKEKVKLNKQ